MGKIDPGFERNRPSNEIRQIRINPAWLDPTFRLICNSAWPRLFKIQTNCYIIELTILYSRIQIEVWISGSVKSRNLKVTHPAWRTDHRIHQLEYFAHRVNFKMENLIPRRRWDQTAGKSEKLGLPIGWILLNSNKFTLTAKGIKILATFSWLTTFPCFLKKTWFLNRD